MALPFNLTPSALISDAILGLNLLTGSLTSDVVAVLDQEDFQQLFQEARPMKARIRENAQIMKHPVESGASLADHRVIEPRSLELLMILTAADFSGAFQQIRSAWLNSTLLTVQTKACVYQNMIIRALPREEDPETFDVTTLTLQMEEVIFALPGGTSSAGSVSYYNPAAANNQSIVLRGLQSAIINPTSALLSLIHSATVWGLR
jgi:hypothetical protein